MRWWGFALYLLGCFLANNCEGKWITFLHISIILFCSLDMEGFMTSLRYLERENCFVVDVFCDNSQYFYHIKKLSFSSHHPVKIIHSQGLRISLKNYKSNKYCKLFVSKSDSKLVEMALNEIKVNEENFYSLVREDSVMNKMCFSATGMKMITKESNCSDRKSNSTIKIPVIFVAYQPYIGEYEYWTMDD